MRIKEELEGEEIKDELGQITLFICIILSNNKNKTLDTSNKPMPLLMNSSVSSVARSLISGEKYLENISFTNFNKVSKITNS